MPQKGRAARLLAIQWIVSAAAKALFGQHRAACLATDWVIPSGLMSVSFGEAIVRLGPAFAQLFRSSRPGGQGLAALRDATEQRFQVKKLPAPRRDLSAGCGMARPLSIVVSCKPRRFRLKLESKQSRKEEELLGEDFNATTPTHEDERQDDVCLYLLCRCVCRDGRGI